MITKRLHILVAGPPLSGRTSTLNEIANRVDSEDLAGSASHGVVLFRSEVCKARFSIALIPVRDNDPRSYAEASGDRRLERDFRVLALTEAVMMVVDSQRSRFQASLLRIQELEADLQGLGLASGEIPCAFVVRKLDCGAVFGQQEIVARLSWKGPMRVFGAQADAVVDRARDSSKTLPSIDAFNWLAGLTCGCTPMLNNTLR